MYTSVNVHTGMRIDDLAHFLQCAADVVSTLIGTRVMRRHYGSEPASLIDSPDNASTRLRLMSGAATAIMKWDDRVDITRIQVASGENAGQVQFAIDGVVTIGNARYVLDSELLG